MCERILQLDANNEAASVMMADMSFRNVCNTLWVIFSDKANNLKINCRWSLPVLPIISRNCSLHSQHIGQL